MRLKAFALILYFFAISCASTELKQKKEETFKVFNVDYHSLFVASQKALSHYKFKVLSLKGKIIETDIYKFNEVWTLHHNLLKPLHYGLYYKIQLEFISLNKNQSAVKVTKAITKKDNFSKPQNIESDYIEEKLIIYRIKRELLLEKIREKFIKKSF